MPADGPAIWPTWPGSEVGGVLWAEGSCPGDGSWARSCEAVANSVGEDGASEGDAGGDGEGATSENINKNYIFYIAFVFFVFI